MTARTNVCLSTGGRVSKCLSETLQRPSPLTYSGDADSQIPGVFMEGRSVMATGGLCLKCRGRMKRPPDTQQTGRCCGAQGRTHPAGFVPMILLQVVHSDTRTKERVSTFQEMTNTLTLLKNYFTHL